MNKSNLLLINYAMDEKHQVFSHQVDLVNILSRNFDKVTVLTGQVGTYRCSDNVKVISYDWVEGKHIQSLIKFLRIFIKNIRNEKFSVLFSHMTSVQSAFISPITKFLGLKHFLWYAHTSNNLLLKISKLLTNGIITSTPGSCPLSGDKVFPIGQSINKEKFSKKDMISLPITKFVHIGRFDSSKNIEKIISTIKFLRQTNSSLTLEIIGSPSTKSFEDEAQKIKEKFAHQSEFHWLKFTPHIPRASLPDTLKSFDCFIHSFQGSLDKTLVEATFSGLPVATINKEYLQIFGSWESKDAIKQTSLERQLTELLGLSKKEIQTEIDKRYEIAITKHEINGWVDRLLNILKR